MELIVIVAMLSVNAVFAAYEMALASVSRARLEVLQQAGRRGARSAVGMKDRIEGSLAVIQLGITLAGAIAAATGGAAVEDGLAPWLVSTFAVSAATAEFLALTLFVLPLSAVTIVFAELVPKMIGIRNKEGVVLALSPALKVVAEVFRPAVFVFEKTVQGLMRLAGRRGADEPGGDGATGLLELRAAASLARATRIIGPLEERIVMSAVQLSTRTVGDAMVPARDVATLPADASLADALVAAHLQMRTRYPVCTEPGEVQSIVGYVTFKDIIAALRVSPGRPGLRGIVRPISRLPVGMTLAQALNSMIRDRVHIALATEDATVRGLLTMEDIVAELVGDLHDEYDRLPEHLSTMGEGWLAGGGVAVKDLARVLGGTAFAGADGPASLAEWVERTRGTTPRSGDTVTGDGVVVLVRKMRRNRVTEAVVRPVADRPAETA